MLECPQGRWLPYSIRVDYVWIRLTYFQFNQRFKKSLENPSVLARVKYCRDLTSLCLSAKAVRLYMYPRGVTRNNFGYPLFPFGLGLSLLYLGCGKSRVEHLFHVPTV